VAREVVVALPAELGPDERARLAFDFAQEIADQFQVGVDCALHAPSSDGDDRNHHAHLLFTACGVGLDGVLGKKVERLDPIACRRSGMADSVSWLRPRWEHLVNSALAGGGSTERVDHRSHKARGIARHPTVHVGKKSVSARARTDLNARLQSQNARARKLEEQIGKLTRMRARLAARMAIDVANHSIEDLGAMSTIRPKPATISCASRESLILENLSADLTPWQRREAVRPRSQKTAPPTVTGSISDSNFKTSSDNFKAGFEERPPSKPNRSLR